MRCVCSGCACECLCWEEVGLLNNQIRDYLRRQWLGKTEKSNYPEYKEFLQFNNNNKMNNPIQIWAKGLNRQFFK